MKVEFALNQYNRTRPALDESERCSGGRRCSRREFLAASMAFGIGMTLPRHGYPCDTQHQCVILESRGGGTLGVAARSSVRGLIFVYRGDEKFPLCSTYKALLAAVVLQRVDHSEETLSRRIKFNKGDLVPYSPITQYFAGKDGLSVSELCDASIRVSDNTAANLLMEAVGGPEKVNSTLQSWNDFCTRIDRIEPAINEASPGDNRDTTTPMAMAATLEHIFCSNILSVQSKMLLAGWMQQSNTGDRRLRAGLPADWFVGDKSGSGNRNATNDVAAIWLPRGECIFIAAYYIDSNKNSLYRERTLAEIGRMVAECTG